MIKYNATYDRWVSDNGDIYWKDYSGNLVLCKLNECLGYFRIWISKPKRTFVLVHRLVYETFKGPIPNGMEIDHEDTHRENNKLSNLRICTHKQNMNNKLTKAKMNEHSQKNVIKSEFGRKFKEHFGFSGYENRRLYDTEFHWYNNHNHKCRWE